MKSNIYLAKHFRYLVIVLCILLNGISHQAKAQLVLVPDSNFRNALIVQGYGSCFTGNYIDMTCALVSGCTNLFVGQENISDLTGISAFTNLTYLSCYNNQLTNLPTLPNSLNELICSNNQLTYLPILPNSLISLICDFNQLTYLPTLPNSLTNLSCDHNKLTNLPTLPNSLTVLFCRFNQLTNFPTLPNTLVWLLCKDNQLTNLPTLPNSLKILDCSYNQLANLPTLPNSLTELDCEYNQLTNLPTLANSLTNLNCYYNQLTNLPTLPNSIQLLYCYSNQLINLPTLPNSLIRLYCYSNQLTNLPTLPNSLTDLRCNYNQLINLPSLPNSLSNLVCFNNQLTSLPEFPSSLVNLYCFDNTNLYCLPDLKNLTILYFYNTGVTCLPNYGHVTSSNPPINSVPLCGFFNPSGCVSYWNISGKTYFDADTNCLFNNGDFNESDFKINLYENGNLKQQAFTGGEGYYSFDTDSLGIYETVLDTTDIPFIVRCPVSLTYSDTLVVNDTLKYDKNFSLKCKSGFDLAATSIYGQSFIPGHIVPVYINAGDFSNKFGAHCASGVGGTVSIIYSGAVNYGGPIVGALTPSLINGDTLTYTIADFGTVDYASSFNFILNVDTIATIGTQVCISVAISPAVDNNPTNNFISQCYTVLGSFDPNEKIVSPEGLLDINGDRWLTYTVGFQNTGTAPAEHIYITDTLDSNLDLSTFQLLAYSHSPYVQILNGGIAKFNFKNINLPDSVSNEPASHGYVQYKIKAKDSLAAGIQISNTAYIYFDFNTPVITNTVTNSVINCGQNVQNSLISICQGETYNFNGLILNATGSYSQKFVSSSGCDSTITLSLQVNPKYSSSITQTICGGDFYQFNGQNLMLPGVYVLNSATTLGCDSTVTLTLNVDQVNTTVTQSQDTLVASAISATYQWINCTTGNLILNAMAQNFVPSTSGNYAVIVSSGTCTDTSSCHYISLTGISKNFTSDISVSPNPSSDAFVVNCPQNIIGNNLSLKVFDAYGKLIEQKQIVSGNTILNATNWSKGIYFLELNIFGNTTVKKLVKQ